METRNVSSRCRSCKVLEFEREINDGFILMISLHRYIVIKQKIFVETFGQSVDCIKHIVINQHIFVETFGQSVDLTNSENLKRK